jgi:ribonucleoside-diphosphate reductase alpha chain
MQTQSRGVSRDEPAVETGPENGASVAELNVTAPGQYRVIRRNGKVTGFDAEKIKVAMTKAFLAVEGGNAAASRRIHDTVDDLTAQVVHGLERGRPDGGTFHIEDVQDQVELALMRAGEHKIARDYVLYREERAREREQHAHEDTAAVDEAHRLRVTTADGSSKELNLERIGKLLSGATAGLDGVDGQPVIDEALRNLYDNIPENEVGTALVMATRVLIEKEPDYTYVAARLLLDNMRREALSFLAGGATEATQEEMADSYADYFQRYIRRGAGPRQAGSGVAPRTRSAIHVSRAADAV